MQSSQTSLARSNVSAAVASAVRERVISGALPAGGRVNEVQLARSLGVSRTPLREALTLLIGEGFLVSEPCRGCFVRSLSVAEMKNLYDVRAILDPAALRLAGLPADSQRAELERLNRAIAKARRPEKIIELDDAWHLLLLSHGRNTLMLELIQQHMLRTRRYEYAYMREQRHVAVAVDEHEHILVALERGDLEGACTALERNMISACGPLLDWLRAREQAAGEDAA